MAKKGFVASAVQAAVAAAEKAIAPSPLAKKVIAAAAAEAVRQVERRAPEILIPVEKALQKNTGKLAKPVDQALASEPQPSSERKRPRRKSPARKSTRGKAGARKTAASRKTSKSSRARASAARKATAETGGRRKSKKSKRR